MANVRKSFNEIMTFTRASTGTYFDANGVLREAAVDEVRYDHDPVTGEALGVLIEESRTNELVNSKALDTTGWATIRADLAVVTGQFSGFNAFELTVNDDTALATAYSGSSISADNEDHAVRVFLKKGQHRYIGVRTRSFTHTYATMVDTETLELKPDPGGYGLTSAEVFDLGDWVMLEGHVDGHTGDNRRFNIDFRDSTGDAVAVPIGTKLTFLLPQWENGTKQVSSVIPTSGSTVTRAVDNLSRALGDEFKQSGFSVYLEYEKITGAETANAIRINDGTGSNRVEFFGDSSSSTSSNNSLFVVDSSGTRLALISRSPLTVGQVYKVAYSVSSSEAILTIDGVSSSESYSGSLPSVNQLVAPFGRIKRILYYPKTLTQSELEALTA